MTILEIEEPNRPTELQLDIRGPAFKAGIPVPLLVESLGNVQGLLDKAYLGLIGKRRLTKQERSRFFLQTGGVSHDSLHSSLDIIYAGTQLALPLVGFLGPSGIWEYAKQAYEFATLVFQSVKRGENISYAWNADQSVLHVNTGTQTQVFNGPVFNIASLSLPHYQSLAALGQPGEIIDIRLGQRNHNEIVFRQQDRELFELPTRIEEVPYKVACEVFEFDKIDRAGRLKVHPGESIPEGDYRFEIVGKQQVETYIEAMLQQIVKVSCLREIAENPISGEKIYRLQIIDIGS